MDDDSDYTSQLSSTSTPITPTTIPATTTTKTTNPLATNPTRPNASIPSSSLLYASTTASLSKNELNPVLKPRGGITLGTGPQIKSVLGGQRQSTTATGFTKGPGILIAAQPQTNNAMMAAMGMGDSNRRQSILPGFVAGKQPLQQQQQQPPQNTTKAPKPAVGRLSGGMTFDTPSNDSRSDRRRTMMMDDAPAPVLASKASVGSRFMPKAPPTASKQPKAAVSATTDSASSSPYGNSPMSGGDEDNDAPLDFLSTPAPQPRTNNPLNISALPPDLDDIDDEVRFNLDFSLFPGGAVDTHLLTKLPPAKRIQLPSGLFDADSDLKQPTATSTSTNTNLDPNGTNTHSTTTASTTPLAVLPPFSGGEDQPHPLNDTVSTNPFSDTDTDYDDPYALPGITPSKATPSLVRKRKGRATTTSTPIKSKATTTSESALTSTRKVTRQRLNNTLDSTQKPSTTTTAAVAASPQQQSSSSSTLLSTRASNSLDYTTTGGGGAGQPLKNMGIYTYSTRQPVVVKRLLGAGSAAVFSRKTPFLHFPSSIFRRFDTISKNTQDSITRNSKALVKAAKMGSGTTTGGLAKSSAGFEKNTDVFIAIPSNHNSIGRPHGLKTTSTNPNPILIDLGKVTPQLPLPVYFYNPDVGLMIQSGDTTSSDTNRNELQTDGNFTYPSSGLNAVPINKLGPNLGHSAPLAPGDFFISRSNGFATPGSGNGIINEQEPESYTNLHDFVAQSSSLSFLDQAIVNNPTIMAYSQFVHTTELSGDSGSDGDNDDNASGDEGNSSKSGVIRPNLSTNPLLPALPSGLTVSNIRRMVSGAVRQKVRKMLLSNGTSQAAQTATVQTAKRGTPNKQQKSPSLKDGGDEVRASYDNPKATTEHQLLLSLTEISQKKLSRNIDSLTQILPVTHPTDPFYRKLELFGALQNSTPEDITILNNLRSQKLKEIGMMLKSGATGSGCPPRKIAQNKNFLRSLLKRYYSSIIASLNPPPGHGSARMNDGNSANDPVDPHSESDGDGSDGGRSRRSSRHDLSKRSSASLFAEFDDDGDAGRDSTLMNSNHQDTSEKNQRDDWAPVAHHGFQIATIPSRIPPSPKQTMLGSNGDGNDWYGGGGRMYRSNTKTIAQLIQSCYYVKQYQQINIKKEFQTFHRFLSLREKWEDYFEGQIAREEKEEEATNDKEGSHAKINKNSSLSSATPYSAAAAFKVLKRLDAEIYKQSDKIRLIQMYSDFPSTEKLSLNFFHNFWRQTNPTKPSLSTSLASQPYSRSPHSHRRIVKTMRRSQSKIMRLIRMLTKLNNPPVQSKFILSSHQSNPTLLTNLPDFHVNNDNLDDDETLYEILRYIDTISTPDLFDFFQKHNEIEFGIEDVVSVNQGLKYEVSIDLTNTAADSNTTNPQTTKKVNNTSRANNNRLSTVFEDESDSKTGKQGMGDDAKNGGQLGTGNGNTRRTNPLTGQRYEFYSNDLDKSEPQGETVFTAIVEKTEEEWDFVNQIEDLLVQECGGTDDDTNSGEEDQRDKDEKPTPATATTILSYSTPHSHLPVPDIQTSITLNSTDISFNPHYLSGMMIYSNQSLQPPPLSRIQAFPDGTMMTNKGLFTPLFTAASSPSSSSHNHTSIFQRKTVRDGAAVYAPIPQSIGEVKFDGSYQDMLHFTSKPTHFLTLSDPHSLVELAQLELRAILRKVDEENVALMGAGLHQLDRKSSSSRSQASITQQQLSQNLSSLSRTSSSADLIALLTSIGIDKDSIGDMARLKELTGDQFKSDTPKKRDGRRKQSSGKTGSQQDLLTQSLPTSSSSTSSGLFEPAKELYSSMANAPAENPPLGIQGEMVADWTHATNPVVNFGLKNPFINPETFEQQHYTTIPPPNSPFYRTGHTPIYLEQCQYPQILVEIPVNIRPLVLQCQMANISLSPPSIAFRFNVQPFTNTPNNENINNTNTGMEETAATSSFMAKVVAKSAKTLIKQQPKPPQPLLAPQPSIPIPYFIVFHGYLADPETNSVLPMNITHPDHYVISQSIPIPVFKFTSYTVHQGYLPPIALVKHQLFLSYAYHALLVGRGELRRVFEDNVGRILEHYGLQHNKTNTAMDDNPTPQKRAGASKKTPLTTPASRSKPAAPVKVAPSRRTTRSQSQSQSPAVSGTEMSDTGDDSDTKRSHSAARRSRGGKRSQQQQDDEAATPLSTIPDPDSLIGMLIQGLEPQIGTVGWDISTNQLIYDVVTAKNRMEEQQQQHHHHGMNTDHQHGRKDSANQEAQTNHPLSKLNHCLDGTGQSLPLNTPTDCLNLFSNLIKIKSLTHRKMLLRDHFNLDLIPQPLQTLPQTFEKLAKIGTLSHDLRAFLDRTSLLPGLSPDASNPHQ